MILETVVCTVGEGAAPDSRGLMTLVAVEPQAWTIEGLGTVIAPFLVVMAEDQIENPKIATGDLLQLTVQALGPSGDTLFFQQQSAPVQERPDPTLPHRLQVVVPIPFTVQTAGVHTLSLAVAAKGETQEWKRTVLVRLPADQKKSSAT